MSNNTKTKKNIKVGLKVTLQDGTVKTKYIFRHKNGGCNLDFTPASNTATKFSIDEAEAIINRFENDVVWNTIGIPAGSTYSFFIMF